MSTHEDEKAFSILEQAVSKAQKSLEQTKHFQPFLIDCLETSTLQAASVGYKL